MGHFWEHFRYPHLFLHARCWTRVSSSLNLREPKRISRVRLRRGSDLQEATGHFCGDPCKGEQRTESLTPHADSSDPQSGQVRVLGLSAKEMGGKWSSLRTKWHFCPICSRCRGAANKVPVAVAHMWKIQWPGFWGMGKCSDENKSQMGNGEIGQRGHLRGSDM